jgi:hypothetical protein
MAASECGLGKSRGDGSALSGRCTDFNEPIYSAYGTYAPFDVDTMQYGASCGAAPGNHVPFAIFGDEASTCDQQIDQEEVLLCAASKLADLSEADVPTSWIHAFNGLRYGDNMLALNGGIYAPTIGGSQKELPPLVFPVLDPKTKFIVRDLALQALSYIPLLDSRPHTINGANYSCSELYASAPGLAAGIPRDSAYDKLYNIHTNPGAAGSAYYPPIATWPPTGKRLDQLTQILRATGEMTKDLIERSIDSDLAAAADKVAGLTPEERIQALWVAPNDPFNSMAHAARGPRTLRSSGDRRF